ncbi:cpc1/kpl2 [Trypanosoma cruzi]|nr:cpc1/kpl2 [Trypanosoma cruzi]
MTFSTEEGLLEPLALLAFFCSDRQPIRGAQKAFYVFSREQDGKLTPEELDFAFHVQATNPRDMRFLDAFSPENIAMLYDGESLLAFQSVCERVIGRTMLNNTKAYQRKLFITDDPHVE